MLEHGSPEIGLYQYRVTGHQVSLNDFLLEGFLHLGTMKYIHWYWNYEIKFQNLTKEQQLWNTSAETGRARGSPWLPLFKGFCLPIQTLAFSSFNISNDSSNFWTILLDWQWDILYSLLGLLSASITAAIFDNWFPPVHAKWLTLFSHCTSLVLSLLCYFFHEISLLGGHPLPPSSLMLHRIPLNIVFHSFLVLRKQCIQRNMLAFVSFEVQFHNATTIHTLRCVCVCTWSED